MTKYTSVEIKLRKLHTQTKIRMFIKIGKFIHYTQLHEAENEKIQCMKV